MNPLSVLLAIVAVVVAINKAMSVVMVAVVGVCTYIVVNIILGTFRLMVIKNL